MKIRKILSVIAVLVMTVLVLCGCETEGVTAQVQVEATPAPTKAPPTVSGFEVINVKEDIFHIIDQYILYDPETMVMYTAFYRMGSDASGLAITPMYNTDGTLRVYEPNGE